MLVIPLQPIPSQLVSVTLAEQACQIEVRQTSSGMFVNLYVDNALVIGGVIAENANPIVRSAYLGFTGDLAFLDTQPGPEGPLDPVSTGLGSRFILGWFPPQELPAGVA